MSEDDTPTAEYEAIEGWFTYPVDAMNDGTYPLVHQWGPGCDNDPVCVPVYRKVWR